MRLYPHEAYQGTSPTVDLLVDGVDIHSCRHVVRQIGALPDDSEPAVQFVPISPGTSSGSRIRVRWMELVEAQRLRLQVNVPDTAVPGIYTVRISCNPEEFYTGRFHVREWLDSPGLGFEPPELPAGSEYQRVRVSLIDPAGTARFQDGQTRLVMGGDSSVTVFDVSVDPDATTLSVWVSVSGLALEAGSDARQIEVVAVTGAQIASGVFVVTAPVYPRISIAPHSVIRPAHGDDDVLIPVRISAQNLKLSISSQEMDEDADDADFFGIPVVRFPGTPGLAVRDLHVLSENTLQFSLEVSSAAFMGPAALVLDSGALSVHTTLTILPPETGPAVRLYPRVTEGCRSTDCASRLIIAKGIGFSFDADTSVSVLPSTILLEEAIVLSPETMALHLRTSETEAPTSGSIVFSTNGVSISAGVLFDISDVHHFERVDTQFQGDRKSLLLKLEDTQMNMGAQAAVPRQGGTFFASQAPFGSSILEGRMDGIVLLDYTTVSDAPTGPTRIDVTAGKPVAPIWFQIQPSEAVPWVDMTPDMVFLPDGVTWHTLSGGGGLNLNATVPFATADPAVQVESVEDAGDNMVSIRLRHLPGAASGQGILYAGNGDARSAVSYRAVSGAYPRVVGSFNSILYRSVGRGEVSISMPSGFRNGHIAASLPEGIGVRIDRVYTTYWGQRIKVEFSMDEFGPGGWLGLVLSESGREAVVPIEIVSVNEIGEADRSLTASVIPSSLAPGTKDELVLIQIPDALMAAQPPSRFRRVSSELMTLSEGVHARLSEIPEGPQLSVQALMDLDFGVRTPDRYPGVPLILTTEKGAVIGFVRVHEDEGPVLRNMGIDGSFHYLHATYGDVLLQASFDTPVFDQEHLVALRLDNLSGEYLPKVSLLSQDSRIPFSWVEREGGFAWKKSPFSLLLSSAASFTLTARNMGKRGGVYPGEFRCGHPMYYLGEIASAAETLEYRLPREQDCRVTVAVSARTLTNGAWATPDMRLSRCEESDVCVEPSLGGPDGAPDPRLYFDVMDSASRLVFDALMGTTGFFLVNIRGPSVIRRVSRHPDHSRIELDMEPGTNMEPCALVRRDPDSGQDMQILSLTGVVPDSGIVRVAQSIESWVTVMDAVGISVFEALSAFLLELRCDGMNADSIQVGGSYDPDGLEEGLPLDNGEYDCFTRIGNSVDTNRNRVDVIPGWGCAPDG